MGKIALKLKPEIEARAKANQSAAGGDKSGKGALSANSPKALQPIDTRKELAQAVGIGEQVMGRIAQLSENAPPSLKEALENKKVSVNRGWKIMKAVQQLPQEEQNSVAVEMCRLCGRSTSRMQKQTAAIRLRDCSAKRMSGLFC